MRFNLVSALLLVGVAVGGYATFQSFTPKKGGPVALENGDMRYTLTSRQPENPDHEKKWVLEFPADMPARKTDNEPGNRDMTLELTVSPSDMDEDDVSGSSSFSVTMDLVAFITGYYQFRNGYIGTGPLYCQKRGGAKGKVGLVAVEAMSFEETRDAFKNRSGTLQVTTESDYQRLCSVSHRLTTNYEFYDERYRLRARGGCARASIGPCLFNVWLPQSRIAKLHFSKKHLDHFEVIFADAMTTITNATNEGMSFIPKDVSGIRAAGS